MPSLYHGNDKIKDRTDYGVYHGNEPIYSIFKGSTLAYQYHPFEPEEALLAIQPDPHIPTYEEIDQARENYRKEHIDSKTAMRSRKQANGTWTDEDEEAYLALDAEVTAWIEENLPYPVEE